MAAMCSVPKISPCTLKPSSKRVAFGNSTLVCQRHFNALFFKNFIGDFQSADRFGKAHIGSALIKCFFYVLTGVAPAFSAACTCAGRLSKVWLAVSAVIVSSSRCLSVSLPRE